MIDTLLKEIYKGREDDDVNGLLGDCKENILVHGGESTSTHSGSDYVLIARPTMKEWRYE